jgi:hypothetical protein
MIVILHQWHLFICVHHFSCVIVTLVIVRWGITCTLCSSFPQMCSGAFRRAESEHIGDITLTFTVQLFLIPFHRLAAVLFSRS